MAGLINPAKEIKTRIGKAKIYLNKRQAVRCMAELLGAVKIHIACQKKLVGAEKIEIEYTLDELMSGLSALPELQPYLPEPLSYKRGGERDAFSRMIEILKRISKDLESGGAEEDPEEVEARRKRNALLDRMEDFLLKGDQMMVAACIKKLVEESGGDSYVLMDVAERYYRAHDWRSVLQYALEAIRKNPKEMRAYKLAINAHRFLSEYDEALGLYKKAIAVFGHHANIYVNLAKLYQEWGKLKPAFDAARMTLRLDPDNEEAQQLAVTLARSLGVPWPGAGTATVAPASAAAQPADAENGAPAADPASAPSA